MKKYNEFINEGFMDIFKKLKKSPMTERDDVSSDIAYILKKAYDNDELYLTQIYGKYRTEEWSGAIFQIPYSNGEKRNITISIHQGNINIHDSPDKTFGKQGSVELESDSVGEYGEILNFYINELKGTKFDKSNHNESVITEGKKLLLTDLDPDDGTNSVNKELRPFMNKLIKFTSSGNKMVGKLKDFELDFGEDDDMFNVYLKVKLFNDKTEFTKVDKLKPIEIINDVNESVTISSPDGDEIMVDDEELKKLKDMGYVYKDNSFREEDYESINVIIGNVNEDPDWK